MKATGELLVTPVLHFGSRSADGFTVAPAFAHIEDQNYGIIAGVGPYPTSLEFPINTDLRSLLVVYESYVTINTQSKIITPQLHIANATLGSVTVYASIQRSQMVVEQIA